MPRRQTPWEVISKKDFFAFEERSSAVFAMPSTVFLWSPETDSARRQGGRTSHQSRCEICASALTACTVSRDSSSTRQLTSRITSECDQLTRVNTRNCEINVRRTNNLSRFDARHVTSISAETLRQIESSGRMPIPFWIATPRHQS